MHKTPLLQSYGSLIRFVPSWQAFGLFALMLFAALTEGFGILLLIPLLDLLNGGVSQNGIGQTLWQILGLLNIPQTTGGVLIAFVGLVALRSTIQFSRDRLSTTLQHNIVDHLRISCFSALMQVEWRWLISNRKSDQANLLLTDVSRVGIGLNFGLSLLVTLVTFLVYLWVAFSLSLQMTCLALSGGIIVLGLLTKQRNAALKLGLSMGQANRALQGNVQETLAGIKLAKILGNEQVHLNHFEETVGAVRHQQTAFMASTSLSRSLVQLGGATFLASFLYFGLTYWQTPMPELFTLVLIFSRLIPLLMSGQQQYHHCLHSLPAVHEIQKLLTECRLAAEPQMTTKDIWPVTQAISLENVTVSYTGRDTPALDQVSVSFPVKTTTAIMGHSGAGKSTLADVLIGLLASDSGEVYIDGTPLKREGRMRWRQSVAYVPQEVFLFHDTIRQNLLWGNPKASESELINALQLAAADFVLKLPLGLNTIVGDGGVRLSGGERQRIALARALLKHPSLLILDEATSALDMDNEARIREAIENLHGDLTVVIIGHRLQTLEHADQIVVLENGSISRNETRAAN